jgi:hypothetical protein
MIKYRLAFTMPAETLFALMAKVLPIEDLSVEEIAPTPARPKLVAQRRLEKPPRKKSNRGGPNLKTGANSIIMELLADGAGHAANELKPMFKARGLSENGVGSALEKLRRRGVIHHPAVGLWGIK